MFSKVTDAIKIFFNRLRIEREAPLSLNIPSDRLRSAMEEAEKGELVEYDGVEDMMDDLK
jgi:antitoxin component of RelBE/YafQ-DinJ toxin-antitoxin module